MPWSMSTLTRAFIRRKNKVAWNEKWKKQLWVFVYIKYDKFWSISLGHFIKHEPLISEECKTEPKTKTGAEKTSFPDGWVFVKLNMKWWSTNWVVESSTSLTLILRFSTRLNLAEKGALLLYTVPKKSEKCAI